MLHVPSLIVQPRSRNNEGSTVKAYFIIYYDNCNYIKKQSSLNDTVKRKAEKRKKYSKCHEHTKNKWYKTHKYIKQCRFHKGD